MLLRGRGRIVNVTSAAGKAGVPLMAPTWLPSMRWRDSATSCDSSWVPLAIRVAVIEPGFVWTAMGEKLEHETAETIRALPEQGRRRYGGQLTRWPSRSARTQRTVHIPTSSPRMCFTR